MVSSLHYGRFELMISSVPVVVLFTKFDALLPVALGKVNRQLPLQERVLKVKPLIEGIFNAADVWGRLSCLTYPPKSCVRIEGLYYDLSYTCWGVPLTNIHISHA